MQESGRERRRRMNRRPRHEDLNKAIDEINRKFGKGTIHLASATVGKWQMKREMMNPRYTTRVDEILKVK